MRDSATSAKAAGEGEAEAAAEGGRGRRGGGECGEREQQQAQAAAVQCSAGEWMALLSCADVALTRQWQKHHDKAGSCARRPPAHLR
jgi:hypothetical protein